MFEANFIDVRTFKTIITTLKDLVYVVSWNCSLDGISLETVDLTNETLVCILLKPNLFESFRCDCNCQLDMDVLR